MSGADPITKYREEKSVNGEHTVLNREEMSIIGRGGSDVCLGVGVTSTPANVWGWEPGIGVEVTVEETSDGKRRIVIAEL